MHLPLARFLAGRYRHRGEPYDDLLQTAALGLVKAVDRFDVDRGVAFSSYAVPTILGEIRRYFRDRTWSVHVHRGLQETVVSVGRARAELTQELSRAPTVAELATRMSLPEEVILEALECARSYTARSLDAPIGPAGSEDETVLAETLGVDDPELAEVVLHESLTPALARLPPRHQKIIQLRFFGDQTQTQIARQLGISQMQVSRLLARILANLRRELADS
jgi:RNA polymerase sigma-B factor